MPGVSTGYKQELYFGNEPTGTYGSAVPVAKAMGLVQSIDPTETSNIIKIRTMGGTRDYSNLVPGRFEINGSFEYLIQEGNFLRQAFGDDSGVSTTDGGPRTIAGGGGGSTYLHVLGSSSTPDANSFPSFTLEFTDQESSASKSLKRIYSGCRADTLAISATLDAPVTARVDYIGQKVEISTADATAVTSPTVDPYVFYQGHMYLTSGAISGQSAVTGTVCELNNFDFTLNNNLEAVYYICGTNRPWQSKRSLKELIPKGRDMEGRVTLNFSDKDQYERFLGAAAATTPQDTITKFQTVLDFARTGGPTGTASTNDWMRLVLNSCAFDSANIGGSPEDVVTEEYTLFVESGKCYVLDDYSSSYSSNE